MTQHDGSEPTAPQPGTPQPPPTEPAPVAPPLVAWDAPAPATPTPPSAAPPLVAWAPPPAVTTTSSIGSYEGGPPPFTVGALLTDAFARYGADVLRLFLVAAVASGISWLTSFASVPAAGENPFVRTRGSVDVGGILSLVSFIIGLVAGATLLALAEGGRTLALQRAVRRGIERAGWLFLTTLILGAAFFLVAIVGVILIALLAVIKPVLAVLPAIALGLVLVWAVLRLSLAFPATVADNLNSIDALKVSWRITRPAGVWGRILVAFFLLGLLFLPAAIGALLLIFPVMFESMFGSASDGISRGLVLGVPAVVLSIFTPLTSLLTYSAYRRLVPPFQPSWTGQAIGVAPGMLTPPVVVAEATEAAPPTSGDTPPGATRPEFRVPRLGTAGKALLALAIVADVVGVLAIPYGAAEMVRSLRDFHGFPGLSPGTGLPGANGQVFSGDVVFSADVDVDTCTATAPLFVATRTSDVEWLATPTHPLTSSDEVFLRVSRNGEELATTLQDAATSGCVGSEAPIPDLRSGVYTYELIVNGSIEATGTLLVQ